MEKGKTMIIFTRPLGVYVELHLRAVDGPPCSPAPLSSLQQSCQPLHRGPLPWDLGYGVGMGSAQGGRGGGMEGACPGLISWWSHRITKDLGKASLAQVCDIEQIPASRKGKAEKLLLCINSLHIGKVLAVELNSLFHEASRDLEELLPHREH